MVPSVYPTLRPKRYLDRFSRFCTVHHRVFHYFTVGRFVITQKLPLPLGDRVPHQHMVPRAHLSHYLKRHLDRFRRFCMGPKCYAVQCIVSGEENPPKLPLPLRILSPRRRRTDFVEAMSKQRSTEATFDFDERIVQQYCFDIVSGVDGT